MTMSVDTWMSDDAKDARRKIIAEKDRFFVRFDSLYYGGWSGWIETTRMYAYKLIDVGFTVHAGDGCDSAFLEEPKVR